MFLRRRLASAHLLRGVLVSACETAVKGGLRSVVRNPTRRLITSQARPQAMRSAQSSAIVVPRTESTSWGVVHRYMSSGGAGRGGDGNQDSERVGQYYTGFDDDMDDASGQHRSGSVSTHMHTSGMEIHEQNQLGNASAEHLQKQLNAEGSAPVLSSEMMSRMMRPTQGNNSVLHEAIRERYNKHGAEGLARPPGASLESLSHKEVNQLARALLLGDGVEKDEKRAVELFRKAMEDGNTEGAYTYGVLLHQGLHVEADQHRAVRIFARLARRGHPYAQFALGHAFYTGKGVEMDVEEAFTLYSLAARNGVTPAFFNVANMYANGDGVAKSDHKAVAWYKQGAERGDPYAQFSLATRLCKGQGVRQDFEQGFHWHLKAAEQGMPRAQFNVGNQYFLGKGVEQDFEAAQLWWRKAADQGFTWAQVNLANMLKEGRGVPKDHRQARQLYQLAAEKGNDMAQAILNDWENTHVLADDEDVDDAGQQQSGVNETVRGK